MAPMVTRRGSDGWQRARVAFWSGIALIVAGLLVLGLRRLAVLGHHLGLQARAAQDHQLAAEAVDRGRRPKLQPKYVPKGKASALIRIPKFGKKYVVPVLEGVSPDVLAKGYGHFTKSADPGEVGNYALAAHRVTHGEPLRRMPELRPGDEVVVETVDTTYTYRLDTDPRKLVVPFTGTWVLDPVPKNPDGGPQPAQRQGQRLITLTTCSEIFHTDNRMIAFGHLVKATPKAAG